MLRLRDQVNHILAYHTGKSIRRIARDTERDFYMSAEEAVRYGICDAILTKGCLEEEKDGPISEKK